MAFLSSESLDRLPNASYLGIAPLRICGHESSRIKRQATAGEVIRMNKAVIQEATSEDLNTLLAEVQTDPADRVEAIRARTPVPSHRSG
jgi:hypothetical protein